MKSDIMIFMIRNIMPFYRMINVMIMVMCTIRSVGLIYTCIRCGFSPSIIEVKGSAPHTLVFREASKGQECGGDGLET